MIKRDRIDVHRLVAVGLSVGRGPVVPDDTQHVLGVSVITREGAQLACHLGGCRIGHAGHDRSERTGQGPAFVGQS